MSRVGGSGAGSSGTGGAGGRSKKVEGSGALGKGVKAPKEGAEGAGAREGARTDKGKGAEEKVVAEAGLDKRVGGRGVEAKGLLGECPAPTPKGSNTSEDVPALGERGADL